MKRKNLEVTDVDFLIRNVINRNITPEKALSMCENYQEADELFGRFAECGLLVGLTQNEKGDTPHIVIHDIKLAKNAKLHRFCNRGHVPYSAIYVNWKEVWSIEREHELEMINRWNELYG